MFVVKHPAFAPPSPQQQHRAAAESRKLSPHPGGANAVYASGAAVRSGSGSFHHHPDPSHPASLRPPHASRAFSAPLSTGAAARSRPRTASAVSSESPVSTQSRSSGRPSSSAGLGAPLRSSSGPSSAGASFGSSAAMSPGSSARNSSPPRRARRPSTGAPASRSGSGPTFSSVDADARQSAAARAARDFSAAPRPRRGSLDSQGAAERAEYAHALAAARSTPRPSEAQRAAQAAKGTASAQAGRDGKQKSKHVPYAGLVALPHLTRPSVPFQSTATSPMMLRSNREAQERDRRVGADPFQSASGRSTELTGSWEHAPSPQDGTAQYASLRPEQGNVRLRSVTGPGSSSRAGGDAEGRARRSEDLLSSRRAVDLEHEALQAQAPAKPASRTASIFRLGRGLGRKKKQQPPPPSAPATFEAPNSRGPYLWASPRMQGQSYGDLATSEESGSGSAGALSPGGEPRHSSAESRPAFSSASDLSGRASSDVEGFFSAQNSSSGGARRSSSGSPVTLASRSTASPARERQALSSSNSSGSLPRGRRSSDRGAGHPSGLQPLSSSHDAANGSSSSPILPAPTAMRASGSTESHMSTASAQERRRSLAFLASAIASGGSATSDAAQVRALDAGLSPATSVDDQLRASTSARSSLNPEGRAAGALRRGSPTPTSSPRSASFGKRSHPPQPPPPSAALPATPDELSVDLETADKQATLRPHAVPAGALSVSPTTAWRMASLFKTKLGDSDLALPKSPTIATPPPPPATDYGSQLRSFTMPSALAGARTELSPPQSAVSQATLSPADAAEQSSGAPLQKKPHKTRSQTNLRLLRRPSYLGGQKDTPATSGDESGNSSAPPEVFTRRLLGRPRTSGGEVSASSSRLFDSPVTSPGGSRLNLGADMAATGSAGGWGSGMRSRLELADSSPETERPRYFPPPPAQSTGAASGIVRRRSKTGQPSSGWRIGRARSSSVASVDPLSPSTLSASRSPSEIRPSSAAGPRSATAGAFPVPQSGSKLDSSGGAASLFGGSKSASGTPRQRASSLLPSMPWSRSRTSSSAGIEGLPSGVSLARPSASGDELSPNSPDISFSSVAAGIAARDGAHQDAMRRSSTTTDGPRSAPLDVPGARSASGSGALPLGVPGTIAAAINSSARQSLSLTRDSNEKAASPAERFASADDFMQHVVDTKPRSEIAAVLAASADAMHRDALHAYMRRFYFSGNPLDVALRKLLLSLYLPKETQQIDRVMEAFAKRYNECNEGLYETHDQPYILAFSLMMLHTDAFNKNAKHKMTKADYVRNTSTSRVPVEILEYLYDNLTYAQFIYVDEEESMQRRASEAASASEGGSSFFSAITPGGTSSAGKGRADPYQLIAQGRTADLQADVHSVIPEDTPFSATGTLLEYDIEALNRAFAGAPSIEILAQRRPALPTGSSWGGDMPYASTAMMTTLMLDPEPENVVTLRVTKVGCVSRKDDLEGGKKAQSRKWKTCGLVLTSTQLLFFKDLIWTSALDQQIAEQTEQGTLPNVLVTPRISFFRPDGVLSLGDAIAVRDSSYSKYEHVFRLVAAQGTSTRQYLIQTPSEAEMNDWIGKINFCACFRAGGVRIRGLEPTPPNSRAASVSSQSPALNGRRPSAVPSMTSETLPPPSLALSNSTGNVSMALDKLDFSSPPLSPAAGSRDDVNVVMFASMRRRLNNRRRELQPWITSVTSKLAAQRAALDADLRLARHLGILTPFQKVTRDRIEAAAVPLAQRIRARRLEVVRWQSRKDIMLLELAAGDRAARSLAPASAFEDYDFMRVSPQPQMSSQPSAQWSTTPVMHDTPDGLLDTPFEFAVHDSVASSPSDMRISPSYIRRPSHGSPSSFGGSRPPLRNAAAQSGSFSVLPKHLRHVTESDADSGSDSQPARISQESPSRTAAHARPAGTRREPSFDLEGAFEGFDAVTHQSPALLSSPRMRASAYGDADEPAWRESTLIEALEEPSSTDSDAPVATLARRVSITPVAAGVATLQRFPSRSGLSPPRGAATTPSSR